uniref:Uncharacterized protein n=1 Tax=Arundo donax TaxID=35708 RepID=A0A0A8YZM2_ARUDO
MEKQSALYKDNLEITNNHKLTRIFMYKQNSIIIM